MALQLELLLRAACDGPSYCDVGVVVLKLALP